MEGQIVKNINEYMNAWAKKQFTYKQVSCIATSIKFEKRDRELRGVKIKVKTKEGRNELNKRTACIVNKRLGISSISAEDIRLYKRCFASEYSNRTGKCSWGFEDMNKRLGYDPKTRLEISI